MADLVALLAWGVSRNPVKPWYLLSEFRISAHETKCSHRNAWPGSASVRKMIHLKATRVPQFFGNKSFCDNRHLIRLGAREVP